MSNPRASIQRAVTAPPTPASNAAGFLGSVFVAEPRRTPAPIGKAHGRMRSINLSLTTQAAAQLRRTAADRNLTLGETLVDVIRASNVSHRPHRDGRQPALRRHLSTTNVYVLLTEPEAADLRDRAAASGRSISDYADLAISEPGS